MTSEVEGLKTNEFLRRRKLRIQQVREQSKDIAKKIRLRANAEKYRQLVNLDTTKARDYLEQQDKLIKKLEYLHAKSLASVGASHRDAREVTEDKQEKVDLSKQRAREAAAKLRQRRQERLDEQKKVLDRRLQAREIANEISREKVTSVANKLSKTSNKPSEDTEQAGASEIAPIQKTTTDPKDDEENVEVLKNDMATQWDFDSVPKEWEPQVPHLALPKDDTPKESASRHPESQRRKKRNLFAVSDEMPSSLCGSRVSSVKPSDVVDKPSLSLVSDYIQNRDLRLREYTAVSGKTPDEDLQSIKQTLQRTRAHSRTEGNLFNSVHVADVQVVPVPSWQAEASCGLGAQHVLKNKNCHSESKSSRSINYSQTSRTISSRRTALPNLQPNPVLRGSSPFKRNKVCPGTFSAKSNKEKPSKIDSVVSSLSKKSSVTTYNHSTRDIRDVPCADKKLVIRDQSNADDAYSQALKETSSDNLVKEKEQQKKVQEMRSKIAITKQNVEKEYKDTIAFLNSLPKDNSKPIKSAFKDDSQQQEEKELRQRKLQQEFKKIHKECKRNPRNLLNTKARVQHKNDSDDDFNAKDAQYSWMPVPEGDGGLAIHIIPTKVKEKKCGSSVRFSKIDSYHEYRSRHKHTPPTKDTNGNEKRKVLETVFAEESNQESSVSSESESSSVDNLSLKETKSKKTRDDELSEAERIIIYKVLDSEKLERRCKLKKKSSKTSINVAKSLSFVNKECQAGKHVSIADWDCGDVIGQKGEENSQRGETNKEVSQKSEPQLPSGHVIQGVVKSVSEGGTQSSGVDRRSEPLGNELGDVDFSNIRPNSVSSTSFKTVANEKILPQKSNEEKNLGLFPQTSNEVIIPNLDGKGTEPGKFYIGASGFLKDDAYEVIIQVRKSEKIEVLNTNKEAESDPQTATVTQTPLQLEKALSTENAPKLIDAATGTADKNVGTANGELQSNKEKDLVDKSVNAFFHEYYITPTEAKPVNSVSVQTTLNSTELPPGHFRMSSSTSTAYMSPPEHILPHFLQHETNYYCPFTQERKIQVDNELDDDLFNKTLPSGEKTKKKIAPSMSARTSPNSLHRRRMLKTPPNTARSTVSGYSYNDPKPRKNKKPVSFPRTKSNHKCLKHYDSTTYFKVHVKKARKPVPMTPVPSRMQKCSSKHLSYAANKHDLNPVIKWYVDKLLSMNKEGLRTLEVLNQDCSLVTTPGSSVVNDPLNIRKGEPELQAKISLEQFKMAIVEKIIKDCKFGGKSKKNDDSIRDQGVKGKAFNKFSLRFPRKKSIHKVKSLNISKCLLSKRKDTHITNDSYYYGKAPRSISSSKEHTDSDNSVVSHPHRKSRGKNSSSPNKIHTTERKQNANSSSSNNKDLKTSTKSNDAFLKNRKSNIEQKIFQGASAAHRQELLVKCWDLNSPEVPKTHTSSIPITASTQTSASIDEEINFIKMAEDKLQNMEKIADLTEKCTKRLSNLAKVLDEVRKNKLAYNQVPESPDTNQAAEKYAEVLVELRKHRFDNHQVSESPSETDQTSGKNSETHISTTYEPIVEIKEKQRSPPQCVPADSSLSPAQTSNQFKEDNLRTSIFTTALKDIAKNRRSKSPIPSGTKSPVRSPKKSTESVEQTRFKNRSKPPSALSRKCFRRTPEIVHPHELSTVLEVESPMSIKHKSKSIRNESKNDTVDETAESSLCAKHNKQVALTDVSNNKNPDLLPLSQETKKSSSEPTDESKIQMMDLKQFNAIMLKPFISIQEYAKQCNVSTIEEGSNLGNIPVDDALNEELNSPHSDGSLPDVIGELLKRKIISEPFKFDTGSNMNTTSSDSTLSVLALSKMKKDNKITNAISSNKENLGESSDSLSISSNPDLENAFKKLGMGWASSTLKKTKEHLALSSSSNTSSSSTSQFKFKSFNNNNDFPALVTDSMWSIRNASLSGKKGPSSDAKNAVQQTSMATSMTVKQFLTDELAKRITFGEKSNVDDTDDFLSLYQTKMPDDVKSNRKTICEERSIDSNQRPRTSTPVQIFKCTNYHSSSSSNISNGLFSNADELSSVKGTSNSFRNNSTSEKDDLTVPNFSLRTRKGMSDCSKSDN